MGLRSLLARLLRPRERTAVQAAPAQAVASPAAVRRPPSRPFVTPYSDRVARLQRHGNDDYLWIYWNVHEAERFRVLVSLISETLEAGGNADQRIRVADLGCSSGAFFRALDQGRVAPELDLTGIDVDRRALAFLRSMMEGAKTVEADLTRLNHIGFWDTNRFDFFVSSAVLLLLTEEDMRATLGGIAKVARSVMIVDQVENAEGTSSEVRKLSDHTGYEYEAMCHPFATVLRELGYSDVSVVPLSEHIKGATGIVHARGLAQEKGARDGLEDYDRRVERLQRPDNGYLSVYWNAYTQTRFAEACAIVSSLAPLVVQGETPAKLSLFDFACSTGPLFRALKAHLGPYYALTLAGADADRNAIPFVAENVPDALIFEADPQRLHDLGFSRGERFNFATATSLCYGMDETSVQLLLEELAAMTDILIIGDQIENMDGETAVTMSLVDAAGNSYDAHCHPFRTLLRTLGFSTIVAVPVEQPVKSISGFVVASRSIPLPDDLHELVKGKVSAGYFGPETTPRVGVFPARAAFDTDAPQVEVLPEGIPIDERPLFIGPELIGRNGLKLVADIPEGGSVRFQVELDGGVRLEAGPFQWQRDGYSQGFSNPSEIDVFPDKSEPQPVDAPWLQRHWGSWGKTLSNDGQVVSLTVDKDFDVDANQADGMGPLDLLLYNHPALDLRDATVTIELRGLDFSPNDAEILLWFQNRLPVDAFNARFGSSISSQFPIAANYALTAHPLTAHLLDGAWHKVKIELKNDPSAWSFAGNVFADRENAVRYNYMGLDEALGAVWNFHLLACYPKAVPNYNDKRDMSRYGARPSGTLQVKSLIFERGSSETTRRANADFVFDGGGSGRFRALSKTVSGSEDVGTWHEFSLPEDDRPVVSRIDFDPAAGTVAGRVNAMGFRSWCWLEGAQQDALYLGSTKHGRDFVFRLKGTAPGKRFVVGNEHGAVAFPLGGLASSEPQSHLDRSE